MKNNKSLILLISLLAVTSLTGCNSKKEKEKEISEEMVTEVINQTNINADVHIGEYESMLTGAVEAVPEGADLFTSSTILDAPRDFETSIYYSDESNNLQAVTNLLNNIVS